MNFYFFTKNTIDFLYNFIRILNKAYFFYNNLIKTLIFRKIE
jgi:hypothetical protein